jgi:hypothetical protein
LCPEIVTQLKLAPRLPTLFGKKAYLGKKSWLVVVVTMCSKEERPLESLRVLTRPGLMAGVQVDGIIGKVALAEQPDMPVRAALEVMEALQRELLVAVEVAAVVAVAAALPM